MYTVKTRNWNCRQWIIPILEATAQNAFTLEDGDGKYRTETNSALLAWATWLLWTFLSPFTGGWTYICAPGKYPDANYRRIYL